MVNKIDAFPKNLDSELQSKTSSTKIEIQSLNVPKGGGAIHGLGESFQVNEFAGNVGFSIPIPVSPCRDFSPNLSITYSSGLGNSAWGLGFSLSIPTISRKTSNMIPQYGETDIFILSGAGDLVPNASSLPRVEILNNIKYKVQTYSPRVENLFSLIEYWKSEESGYLNEAFWIIIDKNHIVSIFGKTEQGKISDPNNSGHIFQWLIEETYDPKGQHQLYFYKQENAENIQDVIYEQYRPHEELPNRYLSTLRYGNRFAVMESLLLTAHELVHTPDEWLFELVFDYGEYIDKQAKELLPTYQENPSGWICRDDPFSSYRAGFEIRTYRLCLHTLMYHRFPELGSRPQLISSMKYIYGLNTAGINEMQAIEKSGWCYDIETDKYNIQSLPPVTLSYIKFTPQAGKFALLTEENKSSLSGVINKPYDLVNLYGEGIPGILYADGQTVYYQEPLLSTKIFIKEEHKINPLDLPNIRDIQYSFPRNVISFPTMRQIVRSQSMFMDLAGSGQLDLVININELKGFFEVQPDHNWQNYQPFAKFPNDTHDASQQWVDLTGNGLNDLVQLRDGNLRIYPSLGKNGLGEAMFNTTTSDWPVTLDSSLTTIINFADMSGGGTPSLVEIQNGSVIYWPSVGHGTFGSKVVMENAPYFGPAFSTDRLFLVDIDGSGTTDLIYLESDYVLVYINESGNKFAKEPIRIVLPTLYNKLCQVSFADIFGLGTMCMIISESYESSNPQQWYYDFCQQKKPYLLNKLENNLGAYTEIEYSSSVHYYLEDKKIGLDWFTSLPFPVQVAAQVTIHDEIVGSKLVTKYAYHHGYYNPEEREFAGFGRIDRQDSEYFPKDIKQDDSTYTAPVLTRTWYHTGKIGLNRDTYAQEYYAGDKDAFSFSNNNIDYNNLEPDSLTKSQAYLAMNSMVLRQEVYGLDQDFLTNAPYTVTDYNYCIKLKQVKGSNPYAIYTTHNQETLSYNYMKNSTDPQIHHNIILDVDNYGNVIILGNIAYGRRPTNSALPEQLYLKVTCSINDYINFPLDRNEYLIGISKQTRLYHTPTISSPKGESFTVETLKKEMDKVLGTINDTTTPSSLEAQLLNWEKYYYTKIEQDGSNTILPYGEVSLPLLLSHHVVVELSFAKVEEIFQGILNKNVLEQQLQRGQYVHLDPQQNDYWWTLGLIESYFGQEAFYLPKQTYDNNNNNMYYKYDPYSLLLKQVIDAKENTEENKIINYRLLVAEQIKGINDEITEFKFDLLGRVTYTSYYGYENNEQVGFAPLPLDMQWHFVPDDEDIIQKMIDDPQKYLNTYASYFYYDDAAWVNKKQPPFSISFIAEDYPNSLSKEPSRARVTITYSDGLGRTFQAKQKVEVGEALIYSTNAHKISIGEVKDRWLTSGGKVYDNKGNIVKQYEPYYLNSWQFISDELLDKYGVSDTLYYDATGRVVKILTPKGFIITQDRTAWEITSKDENNNLINSPYYADNKEEHNKIGSILPPYYDPTLTLSDRIELINEAKFFSDVYTKKVVDNLGYKILTEQILKNREANAESQKLQTKYVNDITGKLLSVTDPRGIQSFTYEYSLRGQKFKTNSADAGISATILNFIGNPIYSFNGRNITSITEYDSLYRPSSIWVSHDDNSSQLLQKFEYIDASSEHSEEFKKQNRLKQLYVQYDQSGRVILPSYDLKGDILEHQKQLINLKDSDKTIDWSNPDSEKMLDQKIYPTIYEYNALKQIISSLDPKQNKKQYDYYISGRLNKIKLTDITTGQSTNYITDIQYSAKGQREMIRYGNNTFTNYTYDNLTFKLIKQLTQTQESEVIQDIEYKYDPVGNVVQKADNAIEALCYSNQLVNPIFKYKYDSLYRVVEANGREKACLGMQEESYGMVKSRSAHTNDNEAIQNYLELYKYDFSGNLYETNHIAQQSWTKSMVVSNTSNRAIISTINGNKNKRADLAPDTVDQYFDSVGNQIKTEKINSLIWDYNNNLKQIDIIVRDEDKNDNEYYVYDSANQRIRKVSKTYSNDNQIVTIKETIYLGNLEYFTTRQGTDLDTAIITEEYTSLRVIDPSSSQSVATKEDWTIGKPPGSGELDKTIIRYHLSDMLNSCTVEFLAEYDKQGNLTKSELLSREEYYSFGGSAIFIAYAPAAVLKRYRYSGKERDDLTGFYYYGLRYYAPYFGRWLSPDPAGPVDGLNIYVFVEEDPETYFDLFGEVTTKAEVDAAMQMAEQNLAVSGNPKPLGRYNKSIMLFGANYKTNIPNENINHLGARAVYINQSNRNYKIFTRAATVAEFSFNLSNPKYQGKQIPLLIEFVEQLYKKRGKFITNARIKEAQGTEQENLRKKKGVHFSKASLEYALAKNKKIIFMLNAPLPSGQEITDNVYHGLIDFRDILENRQNSERKLVTSRELRYIYKNWARFQGHVEFKFYDDHRKLRDGLNLVSKFFPPPPKCSCCYSNSTVVPVSS